MHTEAGQLYHLYNQGNNSEAIFTRDEDYRCFLQLAQRHLVPVCEILAWCLMPNHFHFCIQATEASTKETLSGKFLIQAFSRGVGNLLSAYSAQINSMQARTGARFRPRTKLKPVTQSDNRYTHTLIQYIHNNPVQAGLAVSPDDWQYSSAADYAGLHKPWSLCNLAAAEHLGLLS